MFAWMKTAEGGRSPDCLKVESPFLIHMRAKMALLCRAKDAQDQTIVGKPALDNEFKKLDANKMTEEGVTLEDLKRVACFKWMFDAEQLKAFEEFREKTLAAKGTAGKGSKATTEVKKEPLRRRKAGSDTDHEVMTKRKSQFFDYVIVFV